MTFTVEDLANVKDLSPWHVLLLKYPSDLSKKEVIETLRAGFVPPPEALDMIADIMAGEGRALRDGRATLKTMTEGGLVEVRAIAPQESILLKAIYPELTQAAIDKFICAKYHIKSPSGLKTWRREIIGGGEVADYLKKDETGPEYREWLEGVQKAP